MSTVNLEHNELITCDICKRRYNINVYQRHRDENQCLKRNCRRLPFESIKQRSVRIGDKIFSIQRPPQQTDNSVQLSNVREKRKQQISNNNTNNNNTNNNTHHEKRLPKIIPCNNRRRTLDQAKQLLERRTRYKPPWIQNRSSFTKDFELKLNRAKKTLLPVRDLSNKSKKQDLSLKKSTDQLNSHLRTTKFKTDELPIKAFDRCAYNQKFFQHPPQIPSPKTEVSQTSSISKHQGTQVDQTFPSEQVNSLSPSIRKANTWTRSSKQPTARNVISPIQIPTFSESAVGPNHGSTPVVSDENYDDDDEFERYSPTPPSTPQFQQKNNNKTKNNTPRIQENAIIHEQQTLIRPVTYQKPKRSEPKQQPYELQQYYHICKYPLNETHRKTKQSGFHLPPIKPLSHPKNKYFPFVNLKPWR